MTAFTTLTSTMIPLPVANVDTDQIIPARFLKVTDKAGLGDALFADWRYDADGTPNADFMLNDPKHAGAQILVAGDNFGCGSSREHAPWALVGYGIRAVISTRFADIFRSNALKNGLLPVQVDAETLHSLFDLIEEAPDAAVTVNLAAQTVALPGGQTVAFPLDGFAKHCLLNGIDQLGYLMQQLPQAEAYEADHPARVNTMLHFES